MAGLIIILPVLVQGLPQSWQDTIARCLASAAGQAIIGRTKFTPAGPILAPWPGFALFCGYALAVLVTAATLMNRRDA